MGTVVQKTSAMDSEHLGELRANVKAFMDRVAKVYSRNESSLLLDVAPQAHEGARPFFPDSVSVETLDIDPGSGCHYIADICVENSEIIPPGHFDFVACTEVLEHTLDPFAAVNELRRILKPGGLLFLTTPFNLRIHGPLPDCWRFTEHGLRALLKDFEIQELNGLETPDRPLMPIQYTVVAQKS